MFIQEKYLKGPNTDVSAGVEVKCKYCGREFIVPFTSVGADDFVHVCEATECMKAHEKEGMAAKIADIKNEAGGIVNDLKDNLTNEINKALGK